MREDGNRDCGNSYPFTLSIIERRYFK